jgi:hypothetical protein
VTELEDLRGRLQAKLTLEQRRLRRYDDYFEGEQPLSFIAPELLQEVGERVTELVLNWPRFAVESYETRLDIEGFRFAGTEVADDDLWDVWQANDGDFLAQQAHQESLALSRAYAIVGDGDDPDVPLITVESPFHAIHFTDPRTHDISSGLKRWTDLDFVDWCSVYTTAGRTTWRMKDGVWTVDSEDQHDWGVPQLVPLVNSARIANRVEVRPYKDRTMGRSLFHDIIGLADAANKMATDMMVSGEFHAMPRRWATGLQESDFEDEDGNPVNTFRRAASAMWSTENEKASFGQFPEAELSNFHNSIKILAQAASNLLGLPPEYLDFAGSNPTSADAIRASESRLVKRAERIQKVYATRWARVQKLVLLTRGQDDDAKHRIEVAWRDPSTPTKAQQTDATLKLVQGNIIPRQQAWEDLGYTAEQQARMADWFAANGSDPQVDAALAKINGFGSGAA